MHLAIVSSVIAFLLKKPLGLQAGAVLGALFIVLYVYLVGAQPSLERAAIMYLLGALAVLGSLPRKPLTLLSLAFVIQLVLRPASGDSLSFILSYLALAGILVLGELIHDLLRGILPAFLSQSVSASVGAFIATSAVMAGFFGVLQPVGIPAGLFIVPLTTVFMIGAMAYLALSLLLPPLAALSGVFLSLLYDLLQRIVQWAGMTPGIRASNSLAVLGIAVLIAAALVLVWKHRSEAERRLAPFSLA
jgi:competence protein ComEC